MLFIDNGIQLILSAFLINGNRINASAVYFALKMKSNILMKKKPKKKSFNNDDHYVYMDDVPSFDALIFRVVYHQNCVEYTYKILYGSVKKSIYTIINSFVRALQSHRILC